MLSKSRNQLTLSYPSKRDYQTWISKLKHHDVGLSDAIGIKKKI